MYTLTLTETELHELQVLLNAALPVLEEHPNENGEMMPTYYVLHGVLRKINIVRMGE